MSCRKKHCQDPIKEMFAMFSSRNFMIFGLTFQSLIHFELIFLTGLIWGYSFILLQIISNFPSTSYYRDSLFSIKNLWLPSQVIFGCMHGFICTSLEAQTVKNLPAMWETQVFSLGWKDPLEKGMATHSSILACRIPGTEEPSKL